MKKIFIFLSVAVMSVAVNAGSQQGKVTSVLVRQSDGLHYFYISGTANGRPSCANGFSYWMIKDENSAAGRSQLSMLLTAYASGKTVRVTGTGACTRWGDGEDLNTIQLK